jgi:uncharacterized SAM-binding protein YcdF (DUF218 family)
VVEWWAHALASPWGTGEGDVLVVLGGDSLSDGVLGRSSYWRAVYTVRAMKAHPFERVIISGGSNSKGEKPAPAELMRRFVGGHGIDTSNVEAETESSTTRENALKVASLIGGRGGGGKIVLLTSDYHAWRAFRVFRKAGVEVETWPVPDVLKRCGIWYDRAGLFVELCRETAKIGWYWWKGWI